MQVEESHRSREILRAKTSAGLQNHPGFSPAIVPNLEQIICRNWTYKYKIQLVSASVFGGSPCLLPTSDQEPALSLHDSDTLSLLRVEAFPVLPVVPTPSVKVFFNEDILEELQGVLSLANKSLKIAVSWFTNYSLFKQVKEIAASGIRVELITNNDLINNRGYCLNLNELIDAGVEISLIEYPHLLHHKFCIIDEDVVVNGSYNWTRFSAKNYENITVFSNDMDVVETFADEFERLLQNAEHKCVKEMPEFVPESPEYDRSAFRQYVTEELDAEARETTVERDKITVLQKAASLNPDYLEKINPEAIKSYADAFKTVDESLSIKDKIVEMVVNKPVQSSTIPVVTSAVKSHQTSDNVVAHSVVPVTVAQKPVTVLSQADQQVIDKVKASNLFMVLDVSGSMKNTYSDGHVHSISRKALAASLAITDSKEVSLWTFGENAHFIANVGIDSISKLDEVHCKNDGTKLKKFVESANSSITDNSLVIIFTDDDASSISDAILLMQQRQNVFWQIIVYGVTCDNISKSISNVSNTSVVSLTDYASKTDEQISQILLKDYINWKKK